MENEVVLWQQNPIFAAAGEAVCQTLAQRYPAREYAAGDLIVRAGDAVEHLHVLLSGTVRVFHRTADGREAMMKLLRAPVVFGDIELFHGLSFLESVSSVEEIDLARIPRDEYRALLHEHPNAMMSHLEHVTGAFCVAARREHQVFASMEQRVANLLLSYADLYGQREGGAITIRHKLSQQDIAQSLGVVRRSVAQVISEWTKNGMLSKDQGCFALNDAPAFEKLAAAIRGSLCYQMDQPINIEPVQHETSPAQIEVIDGLDSDVGRVLQIEREVLVGRQPPCKLILGDTNVSRIHGRVFLAATGGRYWVEDLQSTNGTFLEDKPVRRAVLRDGARIRFGATEVHFQLLPAAGR